MRKEAKEGGEAWTVWKLEQAVLVSTSKACGGGSLSKHDDRCFFFCFFSLRGCWHEVALMKEFPVDFWNVRRILSMNFRLQAILPFWAFIRLG